MNEPASQSLHDCCASWSLYPVSHVLQVAGKVGEGNCPTSQTRKQQRDFSVLLELTAHGVALQSIVSGLFLRLASAGHENYPPKVPSVI